MKIITTSWDDGHPLDFRIAELLDKYNLQGTFYIPQRNGTQIMMNEQQMRELAKQFEIGGHTLNHIALGNADENTLVKEINGSYLWLKEVTGNTPVSFCFPNGSYDKKAIAAVLRCGYRLARTTELLSTTALSPEGLAPTSLQVFEHSNFTYTKHLAKRAKWKKLTAKMLYYPTSNLVKITENFLDKIEEAGSGCFHLWGHSWEIEKFGMWTKLEELFKRLSVRQDFVFVSNRQLLSLNTDD